MYEFIDGMEIGNGTRGRKFSAESITYLMKTKPYTFLFAFLILNVFGISAQDRTTVTATTDDISDNLDLRAVASIFGDSEDLEDFERRLNDPRTKISNLDLNGDNQVDYLRVIESAERNTHLIVIQSVLGRDRYQDVATVEVERDRQNNVRVQVVGDVFMYGQNYIYEPVYYSQPMIYNYFWVNNYRPYYSPWYWGYYPTYYSYWSPFPVYTYVNHIHVHINHHHNYNYVPIRYSTAAVALHQPIRATAYQNANPTRSFNHRNEGFRNRQDLVRNNANSGIRSNANAGNTVRSNATPSKVQANAPKSALTNNTKSVRSQSVKSETTLIKPSRTKTVTVESPGSAVRSTVSGPKTVSPKSSFTGTSSRSVTVPTRQPQSNMTSSSDVSTPSVNTRPQTVRRSEPVRQQATQSSYSPQRSPQAPQIRTTPSSTRAAAQPQQRSFSGNGNDRRR